MHKYILLFCGLAYASVATAAGLTAVAVDETANEPSAEFWGDVPSTAITLMGQAITAPTGGGTVTTIDLQAAHDGEWLAFRLVWDDRQPDRTVGAATFRDAVAIGFPVKAGANPSPFMGDEKNPVGIWQWTANMDAEARGEGEFDKLYPKTEGVWYFPQDLDVEAQVGQWRYRAPVMGLIAHGFGTLDLQKQTSLEGWGEYDDGKWTVVIRRHLTCEEADVPIFKVGDATKFILAAWDGTAEDVNGRKSVTMVWTDLTLEKTK